jgi:hypothetical protein
MILGNIYGNSDSAQDQLKGVSFSRKVCDMEVASGCSSLGYAYSKGRGVPIDFAKAASFYRKACEMGDTKSCDSASADVLRAQRQTKVDAVQKARAACDKGNADGCYDLANEYESGLYAPLDYKKAASLHSKACELGEPAGCMSVGLMYEIGKGVAKNSDKAMSSYSKAAPLYLAGCNQGHGQSCNVLGNMYEEGRGVAKDEQKAIPFYRKGCDFGHNGACKNISRLTPATP